MDVAGKGADGECGINPSAITLLTMLSYISPDAIHLEMFEAEFTNDGLKAAVNTLVRFSMVTKISSIVNVHRLVQRVVRMDYKEKQVRTLGGEDDEGKSLESMLNLLSILLKKLPSSITPYTTSCVVHAQVAWVHALAYPKLLKQFKDYPKNLYNQVELHGMERILSLLHETLSKYKLYSICKESSEQYLTVECLIAWELVEMGKHQDARMLCKRIYRTAADEVGEFHPLTLDILYGLAIAEYGLGYYSEGMTILEKIIANRTATFNLGPCHKDTLGSLDNHAASLTNIGKYNEALELFKSTLELKEKHHPENRSEINKTRYWIAITTRRKGISSEALQMFRDLHAEQVERLGESHRDTLGCARGIGDCLLSLGKYKDAMEILKHNIELAIKNPSARFKRVNMEYSLARCLFRMERYDEAISQFRIVMEEQISIYGETHPQVLITRKALAEALQCAGCTGEALEH